MDDVYLIEDLEVGRTTLTGELKADTDYQVRVLLSDVEEFQTTLRLAPGELVRDLRYERGDGARRERFPLAPGTEAEELVALIVEHGDGRLEAGLPCDRQWFTRRHERITFAGSDREALVTGMPGDWSGVWLCDASGAVTRAERHDRRPVPLSVRRLATVDLEAHRRQHAPHGYGHFTYSLSWTNVNGARLSVPLRNLRFDPATDPLPEWNLVAPLTCEPMLQVRAGRQLTTLPAPLAR